LDQLHSVAPRRCQRFAVRDALIGRWNTACVCGGVWRNVALHS
jgi:hypothetical protein